jgi:hypothetical protein
VCCNNTSINICKIPLVKRANPTLSFFVTDNKKSICPKGIVAYLPDIFSCFLRVEPEDLNRLGIDCCWGGNSCFDDFIYQFFLYLSLRKVSPKMKN